LHIAPLRDDKITYGTPTWIWSVAVDNGLYVRAYNGQGSRWYQAAVQQKAGRIIAAGMTKEIAFETVEGVHQQPHRRWPSGEAPGQPIPSIDDRRASPRGHNQGHAASDAGLNANAGCELSEPQDGEISRHQMRLCRCEIDGQLVGRHLPMGKSPGE